MRNLFITGNSSGLGLGFTEVALGADWRVYGCSRRGCVITDNHLHDTPCDLTNGDDTDRALSRLLGGVDALDLAILNAGALGGIRDLHDTPNDELRQLFDINLWSQKSVLDWLHAWGRPIGQIVLVSSGASVLGNRGWGGYGLSKAALNMLAKLYAHELPETHLCALAPGLVASPLMEELLRVEDKQRFPALQRLRSAVGTPAMQKPRVAADKIIDVLDRLREWPSGSYIDLREITDPELYRELMAGRKQ